MRSLRNYGHLNQFEGCNGQTMFVLGIFISLINNYMSFILLIIIASCMPEIIFGTPK